MSTEKSNNRQPVAFYIISFTSMWERFSYYGMRAFLVLYMVNDIMDPVKGHLGGLHFDEGVAGIIYGVFNGMCYLLPLLGGYLSDRFLGERRSVLIGGIFIMIGHFTLAADISHATFFVGLTLLAIGNGFFKPTTVTMLGDLYEQGDKRRDSAFTLYYMIFNGGAALAPLLCGFFGETYGYRYGFLVAGIGMAVGLIIYLILGKMYLGNIGMVARHKQAKADAEANKTIKVPLTKEEKQRLQVIFILLFLVIAFWAAFEQAGSTLNLYTDHYINKMIGGWEVPTSWFQSVNPILILGLAPIFSGLWIWLSSRKQNPSTPIKMAIGMLILGTAFLFMIGAVIERGGEIADKTVKANVMWLMGFYVFSTIGELFVSPIGLSMVTKLAPKHMGSLMMGVWFLSFFLAHLISGAIVGFVSSLGAFNIFLIIFIVMVAMGLILFLISKKLLFWMHGRD
jgi:proton-dependent oligopeptide transporter, POT family